MNLLSNDVSRLEFLSLSWNAIWGAPLLLLILSTLMWHDIGWPGLIGILIVLLVGLTQSKRSHTNLMDSSQIPNIMISSLISFQYSRLRENFISGFAARLVSKFRLKTALRTDERVRFMDEIVSGVQVIKMYAWEKPFASLIAKSRKSELNFVRKAGYVRALFMSLLLFTTRMAVFCTMLSIVMFYGAHEITASKVFVISSYFAILSLSMSQSFVRGVAEVSEALVAFKRLQAFLLLDEKKVNQIQNGPDDAPNFARLTVASNVSVALQNVTARWGLPVDNASAKGKKNGKTNGLVQLNGIPKTAPITLNDLSADLPTGKLIGVIGPVGAGKSSLLQAILRELPIESGSIDVNGTLSYASQEPWVFAGTVRQNILFGQEYEKERYNSVIKACALATDFEQLPDGDRTIIGERGTSLSGGQKARVK